MRASPNAVEVAPDLALLEEAAEWVMALRYGADDARDGAAFERWREQSAAHGRAWARAEATLGLFAQLPQGVGKDALQALQRPTRRRHLGALGALMLAAPTGWLAWRAVPWQEWRADIATGTGERRATTLADGTRIVLDTASSADIAFTATQRGLRLLGGEVLVTTHEDPSPRPRPFLVRTAQGIARTLGARFSVRRLDDDTTRIAVFDRSLEIHPIAGDMRLLHAGERADFVAEGVRPAVAVDDTATLWEQGMLLARDLRLGDVVAEMARYRRGVLRCDPAVADLRISGAVSLADTDAGLALLARALPVRIEQATRWWVAVVPR